MSTNNRLLFCGPSAGEELWPYVGRTGTAVGAFLSVNGKCLSEVGAKGTTKFVPPLGAKCHLGPLKQCILASEPDEPFEYSDPNDPGWDVLWQGEMSLRKKAWSHTRVRWEQQGDSCEYWVEGVADTDGDGVYSRLVIHSVVQPGEIPKLIERTQEPEDPGVRLEDILK